MIAISAKMLRILFNAVQLLHMLKFLRCFYQSNSRRYKILQALTKRTSDGGRALSSQSASTSATSAFESLMSSSAKHQLAATTSGDKQKDGSTSITASTAVPKELDTASHVSEQLVKQVEVSYLPDCFSFSHYLSYSCFYYHYFLFYC